MVYTRRHRLLIISLLLLVLTARALVPAGFMPAAGAAQLTLCPDGMLMPAAAAGDATGMAGVVHLHPDHCPFGSAPFAAPIVQMAVIPVLAHAVSTGGLDPSPWVRSARAARTHQARAPPFLIVV